MDLFSKHQLLLILLVLFLSIPSTVAEEEVQVGRYSSVRPVPIAEQADVFQSISKIEFPDTVTTVGDAIRHVLDPEGYQIASGNKIAGEMKVLLDLQLPKTHRSLEPMSLKSILETLAGPVWFVVQDPVHRLVAFELCRENHSEETEE
ncbi:MAG: pili assembly chaperone [Gammaproteobacteria bacterium]|nr:pili assembly chaperone [Gammaproteobacteria bacterium]